MWNSQTKGQNSSDSCGSDRRSSSIYTRSWLVCPSEERSTGSTFGRGKASHTCGRISAVCPHSYSMGTPLCRCQEPTHPQRAFRHHGTIICHNVGSYLWHKVSRSRNTSRRQRPTFVPFGTYGESIYGCRDIVPGIQGSIALDRLCRLCDGCSHGLSAHLQ